MDTHAVVVRDEALEAPKESTLEEQKENERAYTRSILDHHETILRDGGLGIGFPLGEPLPMPLRNTLRRAILMGLPDQVVRTLQVLVYYGAKTKAERRQLGLQSEHEIKLIDLHFCGRGPSRCCAVTGAPDTPTMRAEPSHRIGSLGSSVLTAAPPPVSDANRLLDFLSDVEEALARAGIRNDGSSDLTHLIFYLKASIDGCGVQEKNGPSRKSVDAVIAEIQKRAQSVNLSADKHIGILRWMRSQLETRTKLDRRILFYP